MILSPDDFGGAYRNLDVTVSYADGRPSRQLKELVVCKSSGLLSGWCKALPSKGFDQDGWRPVVNSAECLAQGIDPVEVAKAATPESCILRLGENPCGVTVKEDIPVPQCSRSYKDRKQEIKANIEAEHDAATAAAWYRYESSEKADEAEDVFAAQILRAAGY
jgi:hypothetical protein